MRFAFNQPKLPLHLPIAFQTNNGMEMFPKPSVLSKCNHSIAVSHDHEAGGFTERSVSTLPLHCLTISLSCTMLCTVQYNVRRNRAISIVRWFIEKHTFTV